MDYNQTTPNKERLAMSQKLGAPPTNRFTVHRALSYWYIACKADTLKQAPIAAVIWDTPLVLFRDSSGQPKCLLDRCAHRNVPLSDGTCINGQVQCPYHGWRFNGSGECTHIPALAGTATAQNRTVPSFPCRESQGYIWVYTDLDSMPNHEPYAFPEIDNSEYTHIRYEADFEGTLHSTAENILDVPHTAFLHKGLFRGGEPNLIQTVIRRYSDRADCEYIGEPRPSGLLGKFLAPDGGEVTHFDRFILPSIAQVEYRLDKRHLITTSALTPISDFKTRMYAVVSVKIRSWIPFLQQMVTPFALKIVNQDKVMLAKQRKAIQEFNGENYIYTDVDVLGPSIARLLKRATQNPIAITESPQNEPEAIINGELLA